MKRLSCLSLRSFGYGIAGLDILLALGTLTICSYYLYTVTMVELSHGHPEEVQIINPQGSVFGSIIDYVFVHNLTTAFYLIIAATLWVKALVNLVVAAILMNGIKKQRPICIAPWLINTIISMFIEIAIYIFLDIKIGEVETSVDRRIARSIIFGVFIVLSVLVTYGIYALFRALKLSTGETRELQESIAETSGLFQHVKV